MVWTMLEAIGRGKLPNPPERGGCRRGPTRRAVLVVFALSAIAAWPPPSSWADGCCVCTTCNMPEIFACRDTTTIDQCGILCAQIGCGDPAFSQDAKCLDLPQCFGDCCDGQDGTCSQRRQASCNGAGQVFLSGSSCDGSSCVPRAFTRTPTATSTPTPVPPFSPTRAATGTATPSATATETEVPPASPTGTSTATEAPSETPTPTPPATASETPVATASETPDATASETPDEPATETPTPTASESPSGDPTATATETETPAATPSETIAATATETATPVSSAAATETPTPASSATATEAPSETPTETSSETPTEVPATATEAPPATATNTAPASETPVEATATATAIPIVTATVAPSDTATETAPASTPTETPLPSSTPTEAMPPTATIPPEPFVWIVDLFDFTPRLTGIARAGVSYLEPPANPALQLQDALARFCTQPELAPRLRLDLPAEDCADECELRIFPLQTASLLSIEHLPALSRPGGTFDLLIETPAECEEGSPSTTLRFPASIAYADCGGDCDSDGAVRVNEIIRGVRVRLGLESLAQCPANDGNGDGAVEPGEILRAVDNALGACSS